MSGVLTMVTRVVASERVNFWLTNRIPRRLATRVMGWYSRLESPMLCRLSIAVWQWFGGDLRLHEARRDTFSSVHECFIRELKDGARSVDVRDEVLVSPCDAIVGACGRIDAGTLIQAKGQRYTLDELLVYRELAARHRDGTFVTLRLTSTMYHRFHAPGDGSLDRVVYVAGDLWNVNPPAVRRVPRLYCRNERAILPMTLTLSHQPLTLVPVAAILVASIHLHCLDVLLNVRYRGPNQIPCDSAFRKGDELGYFHHGSTIIVLASAAFDLCDGVREGATIRMGQPLLRQCPPVVER